VADYRFFGFSHGKTQADGFFVDEKDRIAFWPNKHAPGYELPLDLARDVSYRNPIWGTSKAPANGKISYVLATVVAGAAIALYAALTIDPNRQFFDFLFKYLYDTYPDYFSDIGSGAALFAATVVAAFPLAALHRVWVSYRVIKLRAWIRAQPGVVEINEDRPKAVKLRPCDQTAGGPAHLSTRLAHHFSGLLFLILGFVSLNAGPLSASRDGDKLVGLILGLGLLYIAVRWLLANLLRRSARDLDALEPQATAAPTKPVPKPSFGRRILKSVGSLVVTILVGAVIAGAFIAYRSNFTLYDQQTVLDTFCRSVNWTEPDDDVASCAEIPDNAGLIRWAHIPSVSVTIEHSEVQRFADYIESRSILQFEEANLPTIAPGSAHPRVTISVRRPDPDEPLAEYAFHWSFQHLGGVLEIMDYEVNQYDARQSEKRSLERALIVSLAGLRSSATENTETFMLGGWPWVRSTDLYRAILYDPRMYAGMTAAEAIPIARQILTEIGASGSFSEWRERQSQ